MDWADSVAYRLIPPVATEGTLMLGDSIPWRLSEFDLEVFGRFVPREYHLRKALEAIPWDDFHETLAPYYSPDQGRPSHPPVLMLKLEYLR